ncbi:hypothetical protein SAMN05216469_10948 [Ruminococcus albus]|uniref:Uncharacterized protein n=1 Tax=Ruminococcus albus TaxID=1264 RepID=A0A1H7LJH2_RUMAL|nr:hypothetical protein SAMN05216469_10948 [Ruminococcus albus]
MKTCNEDFFHGKLIFKRTFLDMKTNDIMS